MKMIFFALKIEKHIVNQFEQVQFQNQRVIRYMYSLGDFIYNLTLMHFIMHFYLSLVHPISEYASMVWGPCRPEEDIQKDDP